jgi:hypothetical protein
MKYLKIPVDNSDDVEMVTVRLKRGSLTYNIRHNKPPVYENSRTPKPAGLESEAAALLRMSEERASEKTKKQLGQLVAGVERIREHMVRRWGEERVPTDAAKLLAKVVVMIETGEALMQSAVHTMDEAIARKQHAYDGPQVRVDNGY